MPRARRLLPALSLLVLLAATSVSCSSGGGGRGATASCGVVKLEAFDTRSLQHILPNAPEPSYLTDPPTSGPHQPSPPVSGAQAGPLSRPVQVGLLEAGDVLVQYGKVSAGETRSLDGLTGARTVVAPSPVLHSGQIVLTSWLHKQTCTAVDTKAIATFVKAHSGHGPDFHPTAG